MFLEKTDGAGSPVESYLAQYISVLLCADMECQLFAVIDSLVTNIKEEKLSGFVQNASKRTLQSIKKGDLAGFLHQFGEPVKEAFNAQLNDKEDRVTVYNDFVKARHNVAHKHGNTKSFHDIEEALEAAKIILGAFRLALLGKEENL